MYDGTDLSCDVAIRASHHLEVGQQLARRAEEEHGESAVLTNLGRCQHHDHLHDHVHAGPQRDG